MRATFATFAMCHACCIAGSSRDEDGGRKRGRESEERSRSRDRDRRGSGGGRDDKRRSSSRRGEEEEGERGRSRHDSPSASPRRDRWVGWSVGSWGVEEVGGMRRRGHEKKWAGAGAGAGTRVRMQALEGTGGWGAAGGGGGQGAQPLVHSATCCLTACPLIPPLRSLWLVCRGDRDREKSKDRSRDRDDRSRDKSRDRDRGDRKKRRSDKDRERSTGGRDGSDGEEGQEGGRQGGVDLTADLTPEEIQMMQAMGIPFSFDTTQGKMVSVGGGELAGGGKERAD